MRKLFYLLLFAMAVLCCNNPQQDTAGIRILDIEQGLKNRECVKLSQYASAINYIPLETNLECMMSGDEHMKIVKYGNRFFFYSDVSSAPVFCFGTDGKFQRFIGTQGRAANEFRRYIKEFVINEQNGQMLICDMENNLLFYDQEGNYRYTSSLPGNILSIEDDYNIVHKGNGEYFLVGYHPCEVSFDEGFHKCSDDFIIHIDSSGRELFRKPVGPSYALIDLKNRGRVSGRSDKTSLYYNDGIVNIRRTDTIYRYDSQKNTLESEYLFDFGKLQPKGPLTKVTFLPKRAGVFIKSEKFVLFLLMFGKLYFPNMEKKYMRSVFLYDERSKEIKSLEVDPNYGYALEFCGFGTKPGAAKSGYAGFINDLDGGAPFVPRYIKNGKMYQIMDAVRFMDLAEKSKSQAMKKVAASMNEDSNPVVIEVVLK